MELIEWNYAYITDLVEFANDKEIAKNLRDNFPNPYTEQNARDFISFCLATPDVKQLSYAIFYQERAIGNISLTFEEDTSINKNAELGYWLARNYWGKGITTNAVKEICKITFEKYNLNKIHANVYSYNRRSSKVLEKCGFKIEEYCHNSIIKNRNMIDCHVYSLIRPQ
ncbi:N-acetyltransferase GCN5 [Clostridioides difficile]|uniref:GNAT family N-acetyltransferase n=1 Tax=Clostridioides difficile TaxID=1496 RepID=UPI000D1D5D04|nr:GNAT family N-acetyltransferase [Clostridioides difficile]VFC54520.1 N-acetyltransferase GCN5 [Clostridioides difficile]VHX72599.1 N-acetyltransferase GCN5 [Clostridioides difficile]HBE9442459.1 GNAT family N-acetyltransferase [Clostridioides difficile]